MAPVHLGLPLIKHLPTRSHFFDDDVLYILIPGLEIQMSHNAFILGLEVKHTHGDGLFNHVIDPKHLLATHVPWTEDGRERRQLS